VAGAHCAGWCRASASAIATSAATGSRAPGTLNSDSTTANISGEAAAAAVSVATGSVKQPADEASALAAPETVGARSAGSRMAALRESTLDDQQRRDWKRAYFS